MSSAIYIEQSNFNQLNVPRRFQFENLDIVQMNMKFAFFQAIFLVLKTKSNDFGKDGTIFDVTIISFFRQNIGDFTDTVNFTLLSHSLTHSLAHICAAVYVHFI